MVTAQSSWHTWRLRTGSKPVLSSSHSTSAGRDQETECGRQQLAKMARQALTWSLTHRISVPSPADMVAPVANLHTPLNPRAHRLLSISRFPIPHRLPSPLTWITDMPDPTTATAMDMEMEPGTLSTTTQQDFIPIMAAMETDLCQARWEALVSAPHTAQSLQHTPLAAVMVSTHTQMSTRCCRTMRNLSLHPNSPAPSNTCRESLRLRMEVCPQQREWET